MDNRPALQPREVKFCDLVPSSGKHGGGTPVKGERRWFRPAPQKFTAHATKTMKVSHADGVEGESDQDDERRRSRARGVHDSKMVKLTKTKTLSKLPAQLELYSNPIEISGNAVLVENGSSNAVCALSVLKNCVAHERQLKEELARTNAAKTQAFRTVISTYLSSVTQANRPIPGRRKMTMELALAQCSVVAQTLVVTIQSYVRGLESRMRVVSRFCIWRNTLEGTQRTGQSARSDWLKGGESELEQSLSKTTDSHRDLLDNEEISRLKQLYFDYYDCDVYVVPGGRPASRIPPDAQLLDSLSGYGSFVPEGEDAEGSSVFSSSSACDKLKVEAKEEEAPPSQFT